MIAVNNFKVGNFPMLVPNRPVNEKAVSRIFGGDTVCGANQCQLISSPRYKNRKCHSQHGSDGQPKGIPQRVCYCLAPFAPISGHGLTPIKTDHGRQWVSFDWLPCDITVPFIGKPLFTRSKSRPASKAAGEIRQQQGRRCIHDVAGARYLECFICAEQSQKTVLAKNGVDVIGAEIAWLNEHGDYAWKAFVHVFKLAR